MLMKQRSCSSRQRQPVQASPALLLWPPLRARVASARPAAPCRAGASTMTCPVCGTAVQPPPAHVADPVTARELAWIVELQRAR
eukprot:6204138-Pleurochrysis_carterae.AAC.3